MTGSLWEDSQIDTRTGGRETLGSRGGRERDIEHSAVEELPHADRPSILPQLREEEADIQKVKTREQEVHVEKSSLSDG
jgi:hypothetical protein